MNSQNSQVGNWKDQLLPGGRNIHSVLSRTHPSHPDRSVGHSADKFVDALLSVLTPKEAATLVRHLADSIEGLNQ